MRWCASRSPTRASASPRKRCRGYSIVFSVWIHHVHKPRAAPASVWRSCRASCCFMAARWRLSASQGRVPGSFSACLLSPPRWRTCNVADEVLAGTFPDMNVGWLNPPVTDDCHLPRDKLDDFGTVVVLEPVVYREPAPGNSLRIRLLINQQAAFAAIGLEGIMLAHDDFHLSISIQICNRDGMGRTNLVDDVQVKFTVTRTAGILQPPYGGEERLVNIPVDIFHGEENVRAPIAINVGDRNAANRFQVGRLQ